MKRLFKVEIQLNFADNSEEYVLLDTAESLANLLIRYQDLYCLGSALDAVSKNHFKKFYFENGRIYFLEKMYKDYSEKN